MNPVDEATDVLVSSTLVATFSENIVAGSGNIRIKNIDTVSETIIPVGDTQITISGMSLSIDLDADLDQNANYAIWIEANAITDSSGNHFAGLLDDTTWGFSTITSAPAVIIESSFSGSFEAVNSAIELAYDGVQAGNDLINGLAATVSTGWSAANGSTVNELNDGIHGSFIEGDVEGAWSNEGAVVEYYLGANALGYDITSIQTIASFGDFGFGNQVWTVEVKPVGGNYTLLATVNYTPFNGTGGATRINIDGLNATGIEFIRFTAGSTEGKSVGNDFVFREIDVTGVATSYILDDLYEAKYDLLVVNGSGSGSFSASTFINIDANDPPVGKKFSGWVSNAGGGFDNVNSTQTKFKMPDNEVTVTALFEDILNDTIVIDRVVRDNNNNKRYDDSDEILQEDYNGIAIIKIEEGNSFLFRVVNFPDFKPVRYEWDYNGDAVIDVISANPEVAFAYNKDGDFTMNITGIDKNNIRKSTSLRVAVVSSAKSRIWIMSPDYTTADNISVAGESLNFLVALSDPSEDKITFEGANYEIIVAPTGTESFTSLGHFEVTGLSSSEVRLKLRLGDAIIGGNLNTDTIYDFCIKATIVNGDVVQSSGVGEQGVVTLRIVTELSEAMIFTTKDEVVRVIDPDVNTEVIKGDGTKITIPTEVTGEEGTITAHIADVGVNPYESFTNNGEYLIFVGACYNIHMSNDGVEFQPNKPVLVHLTIDDTNNDGVIDGTSISEEELVLLHYIDNVGWTVMSPSTINIDSNTVEAYTNSFSLFSLGKLITDSVDPLSSDDSSGESQVEFSTNFSSNSGGGGGCFIRTPFIIQIGI